MFGLLNIDKPPGWTSRDVVNRVQGLVRPAKAGHAGTLDPLATGVLVVCVGQATRLIEFVQAQRKSYRGTFRLGCESDTEDSEGQVQELVGAPQPTRNELQNVLPRFIGDIEQRPPAFSALKIDGQRAYKLARRGEVVELATRIIHVFDLRIVRYEFPELVLDIDCGSGTYVRSLGRDIAQALGTRAIMTALVRTAIGVFRLENALALDSLTSENVPQLLLPASQAVVDLPQTIVDDDQLRRLVQGKQIELPQAVHELQVAAFGRGGRLVAILQPRDNGLWQPVRVFVAT